MMQDVRRVCEPHRIVPSRGPRLTVGRPDPWHVSAFSDARVVTGGEDDMAGPTCAIEIWIEAANAALAPEASRGESSSSDARFGSPGIPDPPS
jgi:hypothetical protein